MAGSAADSWEMPLKIAPVAIQQDLQLDLRALDVFKAVLCAGKATWSVEEDRAGTSSWPALVLEHPSYTNGMRTSVVF